MKTRFLVTCLLVLYLSGCATSHHIALTQEKHDAIKAINVYNLVVQEEIEHGMESKMNVSMGHGIFPAVVNTAVESSKQKNAFEMIQPLLSASEHFDYRRVVASGINESLQEGFRLIDPDSTASAVKLTQKQLSSKVAELSEGEAFLYLSTDYYMTPDFKALEASMEAALYLRESGSKHRDVKHSASKSLPEPDYKNSFIYQSNMYGEGDDDSVKRWSENDAALLVEVLKESSNELANLLHYDLTQNPDSSCSEMVSTYRHRRPVSGAVVGFLVGKYGKRFHIRDYQDGRLYSLLDRPPKRKVVIRERDISGGGKCSE
jgi:hypothetical protein